MNTMLSRFVIAFVATFWVLPGCVFAFFIFRLIKRDYSFLSHPVAVLLMALLLNITTGMIFLALPKSLAMVFRFIYGIAGIALVLPGLKHRVFKRIKVDWFLLGLGILVFLGQFHFNSQLLYPSFTDSITHYRYIEGFLNWRDTSGTLIHFLREVRFYHYGFHILVADFAQLTGYEVTEVMLVFGMLMVTLAPFAVDLLVQRFTSEQRAGRLAALTIAIACLFPGFALNWGKYPAILSVVLLPLPLSLIIGMIKQPRLGKNWRTWLLLLVLLGLTGLSHWRSMVVLVVMSLATMAFYKFPRKSIAYGTLAVFAPASLFFLIKDRLRFNVSGGQLAFWAFVFFLALMVMLIRIKRKELSLLPLTIMFYLMARLCVEIPLDKLLPQIGAPVDMPYFRIILPVIAGLFIGVLIGEIKPLLSDTADSLAMKTRYLKDWVGLVFVALLLFGVPIQRKVQPSRGYILVGEQQKEAIDWALQNFEGQKTKLLLAGTPEIDYVEYADAGGWLAEMGDFEVVFAIDNVDFNRTGVHARMCREEIGLIFADYSKATVFSPKVMLDPARYDTLFETADIRLFSPKCQLE